MDSEMRAKKCKKRKNCYFVQFGE